MCCHVNFYIRFKNFNWFQFKDVSNEQRRVSVQIGSALKNNFVVSQSDLWDTQTLSHAKQHSRQSPRNHANKRCQEHSHVNTNTNSNSNYIEQSITGTSPSGPIQRSVSEKNRTKHRHKPNKGNFCQSETDSERERETTTTACSQTRKLIKTSQHYSHHHSSPNVAPDKHKKHRNKTESSIYGAVSESELLDGDTAILPIFRKLLTEKEPRHRGRNNVVGASCPNISIKCDIVEYL